MSQPKTAKYASTGRWARRFGFTVAALVGVMLLCILVAIGLLQFDGPATRAANWAADRFGPWSDADLHIAHAHIDGIGRYSLHDVRLVRADGATMVGIDSAYLHLRPLSLFRARIEIPMISLTGADVSIERRPDSAWDLMAPFSGADSAIASGQRDARAAAKSVHIGSLAVARGRLQARFRPDSLLVIDSIDVRAADVTVPEPLTARIDALAARVYPPSRPDKPAAVSARLAIADGRMRVDTFRIASDSSDVAATGTLLLPGGDTNEIHDIDFVLAAHPLDFRDIGALVPGFDAPGSLRLDARIRGTQRLLEVDVDGTTFDGGSMQLAARFTPATDGPVRYEIDGAVEALDATFWSAGEAPLQSVDASVRVALSGPTLDSLAGTATLNVEGARLGTGTIRSTSIAAEFDNGRAAFTVTGAASPWFELDASGSVRPFDDVPSYEIDVALAQLEPIVRRTTDGTSAGDAGGATISGGDARVQVRGTGFSATEADGQATVVFNADIGRDGDARQSSIRGGNASATWRGRVADARFDFALAGGRVDGSVQAGFTERPMHLRVPSLHVERVDVAQLLGDTVAGRVSLDASGEMTGSDPRTLVANATATLEEARWAQLSVDTGRVDISLDDGAMRIDARAVAPAGRLAALVRSRPFDDVASWTVDRLDVRNLDLAQARAGLPASTINLAFSGTVSGSSRARLTGEGTLRVDSSRVADAPIAAAEMRLALDGGALDLSGGARLLDGGLTFEASALPFDSVPVVHVEDARFDGISVAPFVPGSPGASLTGTATLDLRLPPGSVPDLDGAVRLDGTRLNGAEIESARATIALLNGDATFDVALRSTQGSVDLAGGAVVRRAEADGLTISDANVSGVIDIRDLQRFLGPDAAPAALHANLALSGSGYDPMRMTWDASVDATGRYGEARVDTLRLEGGIANGLLTLDTLAIASNVVRGGGAGVVSLRDAPFSAVRGSRAADAATTTSSAAGRGYPAAVDAAIAQVRGEGFHLELFADSLDAIAHLLDVRPLTLRAGTVVVDAMNIEQGLSVSGSVTLHGLIAGVLAGDSVVLVGDALLRDRQVREATVTLDGADLGWRTTLMEGATATAVWDTAAVRFTADVRRDATHTLAAQGTAYTRQQAVELDRFEVSLPDGSWTLERPARVAWGDSIVFRDLTLASAAGRIAVAGHIDRSATQDLTIQLDSVPTRGFAEFIGVRDIAGLLSGDVRLTGPAEHVALDGDLDVMFGQTSVDVQVQTVDRSLRVNAGLEDGAGRPMRVEGDVPFVLSLAPEPDTVAGAVVAAARARPAVVAPAPGEIALTVVADSFPLDWLTPFVRAAGLDRLRGHIVADARFEGTAESPSLSGDARLVTGHITVPEQGIDYRNVRVELAFEGDRVRVVSARADSDGSATVQGDIVLESLREPRFDLTARFDGFQAARNQWTRVGLSGTASLSGAFSEPRVEGDLQLVDTDIFADAAGAGAMSRPIELTEADYEMLESYFGYRPAEEAVEARDPIEAWGMDIALALSNDVWLRKRTRPEMRIQLSGSLDVRKEPGDSIQLFGTLEAVPRRSYFEQFGKRFHDVSGTVTFFGAPTSWTTDLEARYTVPSAQDPSQPQVTVTLSVEGGMEDLRLTLGSEPEMETSDILSYLATGRPAASAAEFASAGGGEGSVIGTGASFAFGALSGALEQTAAESVGLDVVEIRQQGTSGAVVVAGRYVSPRLFVGFRQPLTIGRDEEGAGGDEATTQVELEYSAFRWLLLNLQGGTTDFRFFLRSRYAY